jgi:hypothetical protein
MASERFGRPKAQTNSLLATDVSVLTCFNCRRAFGAGPTSDGRFDIVDAGRFNIANARHRIEQRTTTTIRYYYDYCNSSTTAIYSYFQSSSDSIGRSNDGSNDCSSSTTAICYYFQSSSDIIGRNNDARADVD